MVKSNVYILGASGLGREVESWIESCVDFRNRFSCKGYLDDNIDALKGFPSDYKVISNIDDFKFKEGDYALLCIADPAIKEDIVRRLNGKVRFLSFVHSSTFIGKNVTVSEGTIIGPNCVLTSNVEIARFVTIIVGTVIGHDSIINEFSSIMVHVTISGNVKIGRSVFIGNNSNLIPGIKIGDFSKISTGSTVMNDIPINALAWGNPAKIISNFFHSR